MKDTFNNAVGPQIRAEKPRPGLIVPALALFSLLAGLQSATQFFAYQADYAAVLGASYHHIYFPWQILYWAAQYEGYPDAIMRAGSIGIMVAGIGMMLLVIVKMVGANTGKVNPYLHGSARWANIRDIRASGLIPRGRTLREVLTRAPEPASAGVYVGAWTDRKGHHHYLRHNGPEHVLCYAPTRSGKGVGLVVPTLLSWPASAVVTDLKGELWALTAGWRKKHAKNKVLRFEPATLAGSVAWNPLDEIRVKTEYEVGDVQNLATLIVDPDGRGLESHWQKTAQALLVGVILHAIYRANAEGKTATLPGVDAMLADPSRGTAELWMDMTQYSHLGQGKNHPVIGSSGRDMMDRPEEEAGSVLSTAKSYLALYRDPIVGRNVSQSQFRIKDLMNETSPVTLYIVTQPNDKARLRPLVRIMVNMVVRLLADQMTFANGRPVAHYKHRLLMMLDEFPSLGKLEILQESLAFVAGYGIKCYLICQDLNQLKSKETGYGPDETITSNCHVQNAFPPNRFETAEHLSKLTGQTTIAKEQITTTGSRTSALHGQVQRTVNETQRPLLTPDECLRMPGPQKTDTGDIAKPGDMVIYVAGYPAIYGQQPLYFKDETFQARASIPAPKASDTLRNATPVGGGIKI